MTKEYKCECGKILYSPQSFNGHKSNCKVHLQATGRWEARQLSRQQSLPKISASVHNYRAAQQNDKLQMWLLTNPTCETCGNLMTTKYGSGRFCSRACANTRNHSAATKEKMRISGKLSSPEGQAKLRNIREAEYLQSPNFCKVCDKLLSYDLKDRITCSDDCYSKLRADIRATTMEEQGVHSGFNTTFLKSSFKYGFYKGIKCDSGWELAFLLYHLAKRSNITRSTEYFIYQFDGATRRYYPDFVVDGIYYEIKGYKDDKFFEKVAQFPEDKQLVVIDSTSIKPYIDFAEETYGEDFYTLYDADRPNWMQIS